MNSSLPKSTPSRPTHTSSALNPFSRALQEIGGTTIKQATTLPGEMLNDAMSAIFGNSNTPHQDHSQDVDNSDFARSLEQTSHQEQRDAFDLEKRRSLNHQELQMTEVFNMREAKDKEIIKQLQEQLRSLVHEVESLDKSTQTAIYSDVVNPGTYHVHFFQQLLNFVILMRKRVNEANTWIENFNSRSKRQGAFWSQVNSKHGGTAYMMSQEHQIARSVG